MAGAAGDVIAMAGLIGNTCNAIGGRVIEKDTLKSLLKFYQDRIENNARFIELGLQLRHRGIDTIICTAEWLASKHIKLANAKWGIFFDCRSGPASIHRCFRFHRKRLGRLRRVDMLPEQLVEGCWTSPQNKRCRRGA
jgi:hypothetical protein